MSRKTAREIAMKLVFSRLLGGGGDYAELLDLSGLEEDRPDEADKQYANTILTGIEAHQSEIDAAINSQSYGWTAEHMPLVDLSILRVAVYEIKFCEDIPEGVSINEAVELAKLFGGEKSSAYINGVLGGILRAQGQQPE